MHYFTLVVLPPANGSEPDVPAAVERALAPYDEELQIEHLVDEDGEVYWHNPQGFWDWYQIGGRWTGHLSDYDPAADIANREVCDQCHGSGWRDWSTTNWDEAKQGSLADWIEHCHGCNGCMGKGWRVAWQLVPFAGDVARLGDVRHYLEGTDENGSTRAPYYLVHEGVERTELRNPDWDGVYGPESERPYFLDNREAVAERLASLSDDCTVVVVDVHG